MTAEADAAPRPGCAARRRDGTRCPNPVLVTDGQYCFAHSPQLAEQRAHARRKGGRNRATSVRLWRSLPPELQAIAQQLTAAMEGVQTGDLAPQQAQALASLSRALVAVVEVGSKLALRRQLAAEAEATDDAAVLQQTARFYADLLGVSADELVRDALRLHQLWLARRQQQEQEREREREARHGAD